MHVWSTSGDSTISVPATHYHSVSTPPRWDEVCQERMDGHGLSRRNHNWVLKGETDCSWKQWIFSDVLLCVHELLQTNVPVFSCFIPNGSPWSLWFGIFIFWALRRWQCVTCPVWRMNGWSEALWTLQRVTRTNLWFQIEDRFSKPYKRVFTLAGSCWQGKASGMFRRQTF